MGPNAVSQITKAMREKLKKIKYAEKEGKGD